MDKLAESLRKRAQKLRKIVDDIRNHYAMEHLQEPAPGNFYDERTSNLMASIHSAPGILESPDAEPEILLPLVKRDTQELVQYLRAVERDPNFGLRQLFAGPRYKGLDSSYKPVSFEEVSA